ncbi:MAG: alpha-2-macroglobulin family protein, partial [Bacteroidota bacterium]
SALPADQQLRKKFRDEAAWQPQLTTDEQGVAYYTIDYPDNTTQWKNYVIGRSRQQEMGVAFSAVNAYKSVMARLSVPRFLIQGDRSTILGKSLNYKGDTLAVTSTFKVNGQIVQQKEQSLANVLIERVEVHTPAQDSLELTYALAIDNYGDGEQRKVPIFPKGIAEQEGQFYTLSGDTTIQLQVDPQKGPVHFWAEQGALGVLAKSVEYLIQYPHGCNEQTASRLLANLMAKTIQKVKGQPFQRERYIRKGIKTLSKRQAAEGYWGWWTESKPDIWMTTYVLKTLHQAQQQNYRVPALEKGLFYLTQQLPTLKGRQLLDVLELFAEIGQRLDYEKYLTELQVDLKEPKINDQLTMLKIRQLQGLPHDLTDVLEQMKINAYGDYHWDEPSNDWHHNTIQTS